MLKKAKTFEYKMISTVTIIFFEKALPTPKPSYFEK